MPRRPVLLVVLIGALGCADAELVTEGPPPDASGPDSPPLAMPVLERVGPADLTLDPEARAPLVVRCRTSRGGTCTSVVAFALTGEAAGASVLDPAVRVGEKGEARTTVVAGQPGSFGIVATTPGATKVEWHVTVRELAPAPLALAGGYRLGSTLDLSDAWDGSLLEAVDAVTDDPNDPATWLLDQALAELGDPWISTFVTFFRPGLDQALNQEIRSWAPRFVASLEGLSSGTLALVEHLGLTSQLDLVGEAGAQSLVGQHRISAVAFDLGGTRQELTLVQMLGLSEPSRSNIPVTSDGAERLGIGRHTLALPYRQILSAAIRRLILPRLGGAGSFSDLVQQTFDCGAFGDFVASAAGTGAPDLWQSLCEIILGGLGDELEAAFLASLPEQISLDWQGSATFKDTTRDRLVDELTSGEWRGTAHLGGVEVSLGGAPQNTFEGHRVP